MQPLAFTTALADMRRDESIAAARRFPRLPALFRGPRPYRQTRPERRVGGAR